MKIVTIVGWLDGTQASLVFINKEKVSFWRCDGLSSRHWYVLQCISVLESKTIRLCTVFLKDPQKLLRPKCPLPRKNPKRVSLKSWSSKWTGQDFFRNRMWIRCLKMDSVAGVYGWVMEVIFEYWFSHHMLVLKLLWEAKWSFFKSKKICVERLILTSTPRNHSAGSKVLLLITLGLLVMIPAAMVLIIN